MYNFNHLYYFYVTAKSGGVGAAAKHLRISQPSLSSQLKVLERSLDIRLFRRIGRNNHLTEEGTLVFGFCRKMYELSEEMEGALSKQAPSASRRIHIGVSDEVDRPFVVEVVSSFLRKHGFTQRPKVTVFSGGHEQLVDRLRFREFDAVVTQKAMIDPDLMNLERAEVPVLLAYAKSIKRRASKGGSSIDAVVSGIQGGGPVQWLMPSTRFKLRTEIDHFFEMNQLQGRIVFESDVIASLVRSVTDEIGLAFLPVIYMAREIRERTIRVIGPKEGYWKYRVWLGCHVQSRNDELIQALALSFREVCGEAAVRSTLPK